MGQLLEKIEVAMKLMRTGTILACAICATCSISQAYAQSLDEQAWNSVWDRLALVLPAGTPDEQVHTLPVLVPTTWKDGSEAGQKELQYLASAIPDDTFSVDPNRMKRPLHSVYTDIVFDAAPANLSKNQEEAFRGAAEEFQKAFNNYLTVRTNYIAEWKKHAADLKAMGEPVNTSARIAFRTTMGNMFTEVAQKLDTATARLQAATPPGGQYLKSITLLRGALLGSQLDSTAVGAFPYDGGIATLGSMEDCDDNDLAGWDELAFTNKVRAAKIRSSGWNAGGSWSGSFFSVGLQGGGSNYEKFIRSDTDRVSLKLCNLRYIQFRPGTWFDVPLLQAIDSGSVKLRPNSPYAGKRILGPNGVIPNFVKGAIVARDVSFEAVLQETQLNEVKKSSGGSGGFGIGPIRLGGGGGSSSYSRELSSQIGIYRRSTKSSVPLVVAVVTEPTK